MLANTIAIRALYEIEYPEGYYTMSAEHSKMNKVLVHIVIPCYNEAKRFPMQKFVEFINAHRDIGFTFVNDGSKDHTLSMLTNLKLISPQRIDVLNLTENQGKAEAVRKGFFHALTSTIDIIGFWDADLSTPLSAIFDFMEVFNERPDIKWVFGSRFQALGRVIKRNKIRHYLGRFSATAIAITLKLPIYDSQCGAKLFRVDGNLNFVFREKFISRWIFDVELIARLKILSGDNCLPAKIIYEYPLKKWMDAPGTKLKFSDYFGAILELYKIWRFQNKIS